MSDTNQQTPEPVDNADNTQAPKPVQEPPRDAGFSASLEAFEAREEAPRPARRPRQPRRPRAPRNQPPPEPVPPQPDPVPEIPIGPAPEPFEEDLSPDEAAKLADQDFDEAHGIVPIVEDPVAQVPADDLPETADALPGEIPAQAPDEHPGKRRRGRRRRGRGRRGKGEGQPQSDAPVEAEEPVAPATRPLTPAPVATRPMDREPEIAEESAEPIEMAEATESSTETAAGIIVTIPADGPVDSLPGIPGEKGRRRRRRGRGRRGRGRDQADQAGPAGQVSPVAEPRDLELPAAADLEEVAAEEEEEAEAIPGKIMLVNIAQSDECRIAMLGEDRLQEFYVERTAALSHVGNIYKGIVTNIEPSIQAAFIDFGQGKNGFLHISDLQPQYFPGGGEAEDVGRKTPRKERPPIQKCLRRNQEIIVQVTKEGIGTKGATLTTYSALPGRYLVMMPGMSRLGVSRKIEDEDARRRMRDVLNQLELPGDMGFILRTAGLDRTKRDLQRDLNYLVRLWKQIEKRKNSIKAPAELYRESDLVTRTLRDVVTTDVEEILIDSEPVASSAKQFLRLLSPRLSERVKFYQDSQPLFFKYGVEDEIAKIYSKRVPLASGGYLVIESTEALVAIDVNSGKFREAPDPEESAFRINLEASDEIARQLSLRDLGGVIICDFIDMHMERHRREIERALREALKKHKERAEILRMSRFGIIEMTRQRQRPSIIRSMLIDCPHCTGTGMIKSVETVMLETLRALQTAATHPDVSRIEVRVDPQVAQMLLNTKRRILAELEAANNRSITVLPATDVAANKITLTCFDHRGWPVQVLLPKSMMSAASAGR